MRRHTTLGIGLAAVVVASSAAWFAGRQIQSPAEIAARTAPPKASLIAVPVEQRTLSSEVVVRGTVRFGAPQSVSLPTSPLKTSKSIVSTAPVKGAELTDGAVAFTVSGRPVFVMEGAQPAYRDMGPGTVGTDVQQLEAGLLRYGFDPGPIDGVYDQQTQAAVAAWYQSAGYSPFGPTAEQLAASQTAQGDHFSAQTELLTAKQELAVAQGQLATARQQAAGARVAAAGAPAAEAAAQATFEQDKAAAQADVTTKTNAVQAATDALAAAQKDLADAQAAKPKPTPEELAPLEAAVREAQSNLSAAQADLVASQAALAAVVPPVPGAATDELNRAVAVADIEVSTASQAVGNAQRQVSVLSDKDHATAVALVGVNEQLGVQVPADEVLFFPDLPRRIDDVAVKVGDEITGPVMTVSNLQLAVDSAVSANDAKLIKVGAPVVITQPDLGITVNGQVTQIADTPGTNGADPQRYYLEVTPTDAPATLVGTSVVLTITVDSTKTDVLAVPVAALSVAADGTSRVEVKADDGTTHFVAVTPGLSARGLVAVVPAGALAAGDLVVVGTGASSGNGQAGGTGSTGTPTTDLTGSGPGLTTGSTTPGTGAAPSAPATDTVGSTNAP
jgi:multidrug efflux pump subunit AcrA (membrane-fusion protein)